MVEVTALLGKTLVRIEQIGNDRLIFDASDGSQYVMEHIQDCCESVTIEDITGDLADLIGEPILLAEEATSTNNPPGVTKECQDSFTWTFYKFATRKGYVDIRWYGESNGYYGERVDFQCTREAV